MVDLTAACTMSKCSFCSAIPNATSITGSCRFGLKWGGKEASHVIFMPKFNVPWHVSMNKAKLMYLPNAACYNFTVFRVSASVLQACWA